MSNLPTSKAIINLDRRAELNYKGVRGDTLVLGPTYFSTNGVADNFSGCTFRTQIRKNGTVILELTSVGGEIVVGSGSLLQSATAGTVANWIAGEYKYDTQKTDGSGVVTTILYGSIYLDDDQTR